MQTSDCARVFIISHFTSPLMALAITGLLFAVAPGVRIELLGIGMGFATFVSYPFLLGCAVKLGITLRLISHISVSQLALLMILAMHFFGGVTSFFLPWIITIPVVGMFFLGREGAFIYGGVAVLGVIILALTHATGYAQPSPVSEEWYAVASAAAIFSCLLFVSGMGIGFVSMYRLAQNRLRRESGEHLRTAAQFRATKEAAEVAGAAKMKFLAITSEELRTPLSAIIGYARSIRRQYFGPLRDDRYSAYAEDIEKSGAHLLHIIDEILDLAKLEAGRTELAERTVDLGRLVASATASFETAAEQASVELGHTIPAQPVLAWIDERRMTQAIINVVSNAVKFTPSGGSVRVSMVIDGESRIRISVSDTGIGIPAKQIARVTQPFEQIEDAYARSHGGTGLGLALACKWLELHGGTVELNSVMGNGTTVNMYLPAWRCESAVAQPQFAFGG